MFPGAGLGPEGVRVTFTLFSGGAAHTVGGQRVEQSLAEHAAWRSERGREVARQGADNRPDKKRAPACVGAVLRDGKRREASVEALTWLFLDADGVGEWDGLLEALKGVGAAFVAQRSCGHGEPGPDGRTAVKYHVVLPLSPPRVPSPDHREEYRHLCGVLTAAGGLSGHDQSCHDASRCELVGQRLSESAAPREVVHSGGACLDWAAALAATGYAPPLAGGPSAGQRAGRAAAQQVPVGGADHDPAGGFSGAFCGVTALADDGPTAGHSTGTLCLAVLRWAGLLGAESEPGKYLCRCPWRSEHSAGEDYDSSTVAWTAAGGGFKCLHAHCADRGAAALLSWGRRGGCPLPDRPQWGDDEGAVERGAGGASRDREGAEGVGGVEGEKLGEVSGESWRPSHVSGVAGVDPGRPTAGPPPMTEDEVKAVLGVMGGPRVRVRTEAQEEEAQLCREQRDRYARFIGEDAADLLILSDRGTPSASVANLIRILLNHCDWRTAAGGVEQHVLGWDELAVEVVKLSPPPFAVDGGGVAGPWEDCDTTRLCAWFADAFRVAVGSEAAYAALEVVARVNRFHRVREYLGRLAWDGTARIDSWLVRLLGAPDTEYTRLVGRYWLVSAVARPMQPGCKADCMIVLEGRQGLLKSTALRKLTGGVPGSFSDTEIDLGSKDRFTSLRGVWVHEFAEMASMSRRDTDGIKGFLSSQEDKFRPPYARADVRAPRQCVFSGSVNPQVIEGYLRDETGGRRFWPVPCTAIDLDGIAQERDQLWAEAVHAYRTEARWWPLPEEEGLFRTQQEARAEAVDPWADPIATWVVDGCLDPRTQAPVVPTVTNVILLALHRPLEHHGKADANRVGRIMRSLGWRLGTTARVAGVPSKPFVRDVADEDADLYREALDLCSRIPDQDRRREAIRGLLIGKCTKARILSYRDRAARVLRGEV